MIAQLAPNLTKSQLTTIAQSVVVAKVRYGLPLYGIPRIVPEEPLAKLMNEIQVLLNNLMRVIARK